MLVAGERSTAAEVDIVPVAQGEEVEGKVAGELRGLEVKFAEGLWRSGWSCSGGSAVKQSSPE